MLKKLARASLVILLICSGNAWAASAVIDAVQMPAWLERGGRVLPLLPGQPVVDGDRLRTGPGARAYVRLPEGSTVKLGESALFIYQSASEQDSIFTAALNLAVGAFRFTTAAVRKRQPRDISIRVGNATIGIRGTDVWGRAGEDEDLVMLIEGHVEIQPGQGAALQLTDPLSVFTAAKNAAAHPVTKANQDELRLRARETDIEAGNGALRRGGKGVLRLGRFDDEPPALALYDRVRAAGYGATIRPVKGVEGTSTNYHFDVVIGGFPSSAEAVAAGDRLKRLTGIEAEDRTSIPGSVH